MNITATQASTALRMVAVDGQQLRVCVRGPGQDKPLLIFNGIGANLELLAPFTESLDGVETVVFDVPGVGGSPAPRKPYRFFMLARLARRLMVQLGYAPPYDVLGVSWGGALAQQFALQYPRHCRRLVLVATSPGAVMVPGKLSALAKMVSPQRYANPAYMRAIGPELYGGRIRKDPELLQRHEQHLRAPRGRGYYYQLLAVAGWSSLPWLPLLHQPTLVIAGSDDPIVPAANARLLALMIRNATLRILDDGHLLLITSATTVAPLIAEFLTGDQANADTTNQSATAA